MTGIEKFKEYFQGFEESYVIIGGTACELNMDDIGRAVVRQPFIFIASCVQYAKVKQLQLQSADNAGSLRSICKNKTDEFEISSFFIVPAFNM